MSKSATDFNKRAILISARMPQLTLLRTFESAAWNRSFTLAAQELDVSQSAVSQQISQLEEYLKVRLFRRLSRQLSLTPEGAIFANSFREALAMIARATARLTGPCNSATAKNTAPIGGFPVGRVSLASVELPPLKLLRTFETAAWHQSFTKAANELNISQSAISQQIKKLEDFLGVPLFSRSSRSLEMTTEGATLAHGVRDALIIIARACIRLRNPNVSSTLSINVTPSFGIRWMARRIAYFCEKYPEINVTIISTKDSPNYINGDVDVAIRWSDGLSENVRNFSLGPQPTIPVCSPTYLEGRTPILTPRDLFDHVLLHTIDAAHWPAWFEAAGEQGAEITSNLHFGHSALLLEACVQAQGIALASTYLIADDLEAGRLVPAIDLAIDIGEGFFLMVSKASEHRSAVELFIDWMLSMTREMRTRGGEWQGRTIRFSNT